jgi:hypothetical protein
MRRPNVRLGSKADIASIKCDVRFTPKSGHWRAIVECPLWANSRHSAVSFDHLVGKRDQFIGYAETQRFRGLEVDR